MHEWMTRGELERLDRDALIEKATAAGVPRAKILTRPELIDELLMRQTASDAKAARRVRGFFGMARDLVARVVERGLHLPDAAERIRGLPIPAMRTAPAALPTMTLAEIYAAQGHKDRAIETLKKLLELEPEHAAAKTLLAQLEDARYKGPAPAMPPEPEEEAPSQPTSTQSSRGPTTLASPPLQPYARWDECIAIPEGRTALFVYWGVRKTTMDRIGDGDKLTLRVLVVEPTWEGPRASERDVSVSGGMGHVVVRDLPQGAVLRVAIGSKKSGTFVPVAHSPALERNGTGLMRWTTAGNALVSPSDPDAASIARARERMTL
jgi:hypothetical protein